MSKTFNNNSTEQFEVMRSAAETEAQGILKARNTALRVAAETEAQGILKARNAALRSVAETEAQDILKSRNAALNTISYTKTINQNNKPSTPGTENIKALAVALGESIRDLITAFLREKEGDVKLKLKSLKATFNASYRTTTQVVIKNVKKTENLIPIGCILFIILIIAFWGIVSSIKSCQEEREAQQHLSSYAEERMTGNNDGGYDEINCEEVNCEEISIDDNSSVEEMLEKRFDYVCEYDHYFEIKKGGMYGIADLKGNIKIEPKYDYICSADEDLGVVEVKKDGKYGMVSLKSLQEIIRPKYDYISSVSEESKTIEVRTNSKYGLLSSVNLTEIIEPIYDYIGSYNEETGLFEVRKNSKYGLFSPSLKKEVASCIFSYISYEGGLYLVRKDGKSGYLNADGSTLKPLQ